MFEVNDEYSNRTDDDDDLIDDDDVKNYKHQ